MKKYILLIIISLFMKIGISQNSGSKKWVKFTGDKEINYKKEHKLSGVGLKEKDFPIKILKDEIYENHEEAGNQDYIVYGKDILRCPNGFIDIKIKTTEYLSLLKLKESLVQKEKKGVIYKIDISNIVSFYSNEQRDSASIFYKKNNGNLITEFKAETSAQQSDIEKVTKLIIPSYPTLIYYENELRIYEKTKPIPSIGYEIIGMTHEDSLLALVGGIANPKKIYRIHKDDTTEADLNKIKNKVELTKGDIILNDETFFSLSKYTKTTIGWTKIKQLNYILIVWLLLVVALLFGLYKLLKNKIRKPTFTENYKGGSFREFAEKNGTTVKNLIKLNKKDLYGYSDLENHKNQRNQGILKKIKNKTLIKGFYFSLKKRSISNLNTQKVIDPEKKSTKPNHNNTVIKTDFSEIKTHISNEFKTQTDLIKEEIMSLKSDPDMEVLNLRNDLVKKEKEISSLNENFNQLQTENTSLKEEKDKIDQKRSKLQGLYAETESNLRKYNSLISFTPFLKTLGHNYFNLLEDLSACQKRINDLIFNSQTQLSDKEIHVIFKINTIYPNSFNTGYWKKLFRNMSEGFLSDFKLVTMMNDFQNEKEKIGFLEKYCYDNFWKNYINVVLLYSEHIRFLKKLTEENTEFSITIKRLATNCIRKVISKSKELANYDVNYVSLLDSLDKYKFTKASSEKPEDIFLKLKTNSETIIKIVSFGFKKNHDFETEETWVIIK